MRLEVHLHADIPMLEGVSKKQIEQALAPLLDYLDAEGMADVKSLEPDEPGLRYDDKELMFLMCWTGEVGRSFHPALDAALENLGPLCYEAVEVELTLYLQNGEQESRLLFVGPTAHAIHEAQRRCMIEDVTAVLARQFGKERSPRWWRWSTACSSRTGRSARSRRRSPSARSRPRPGRRASTCTESWRAA